MFESSSEVVGVEGVPEAVVEAAAAASADQERTIRETIQSRSEYVAGLRSEYVDWKRSAVGSENLERLARFRTDLQMSKPRHRRMEESLRFFDSIGLDLDEILERRTGYDLKLLEVLPTSDEVIADDVGARTLDCDVNDPSWAIYEPPYPGFFWSYHWDRSDEPDDPVLTRYLDRQTGRIGSAVALRVDGADNSDTAEAEYYTALKLWHQVAADGPLEVCLSLSRRSAAGYSGSIEDEFGLSSALLSQFARTQLRVLAPDGSWSTQQNSLFGFIEFEWGSNEYWNGWAIPQNSGRWYHFRDDRSFDAGTWLMIEAAVENVAWFDVDDESVTMKADLDLQLDWVKIRSRG